MSVSLSIIVCVYRDTHFLEEICKQYLESIPSNEPYELIFVNDGNINNDVYKTLEVLKEKDKKVRVIHLSRNFGQHIAIAAGMKNACGEYVMVMDSDMQYHPADCYRMYKWARQQGRDAVFSVISQSKHPLFRRITAKAYYNFLQFLGLPTRNDLGSLFVISQHVCQGLLKIGDRHRMTMPLISWLGGDLGYYEIKHHPREQGKSSYNITRLVRHAVNGVTTFSNKPLYISIVASFTFGLVAVMVTIWLLYEHYILGQHFLTGWLSTVVVVLCSSSAILFCLGIVGLYLGRMAETGRQRPLYFVQAQSRENSSLFED